MWPLVGECWKIFPPPQFISSDLGVISTTAGTAGCACAELPDKSNDFSCETTEVWELCCEAPRRSCVHAACALSSPLHRTAGAAPLLAWNRMLQAQNQYQPGQFQALGGPMGYPQRPEDRMDRGRQVRKPHPARCARGGGSGRGGGGCSWLLLTQQPKHGQVSVPALPSPLCAWQRVTAVALLPPLLVTSKSNVLPSHTLLAA